MAAVLEPPFLIEEHSHLVRRLHDRRFQVKLHLAMVQHIQAFVGLIARSLRHQIQRIPRHRHPGRIGGPFTGGFVGMLARRRPVMDRPIDLQDGVQPRIGVIVEFDAFLFRQGCNLVE